MIDSNERLRARLHALRSEFDQAFARPRQPSQGAGADFLLIRVSGEPYALRLAEVAALEADRVITPVPSDAPALLGVAGLRGALVAVFDLAQLLGHAPASRAAAPQSGGAPRWLLLVKGSLVAVAFGEFEGQRRLSLEPLATPLEAGQRQQMVLAAGVPRPIIELAPLVARCEPPLPPSPGQESR